LTIVVTGFYERSVELAIANYGELLLTERHVLFWESFGTANSIAGPARDH